MDPDLLILESGHRKHTSGALGSRRLPIRIYRLNEQITGRESHSLVPHTLSFWKVLVMALAEVTRHRGITCLR